MHFKSIIAVLFFAFLLSACANQTSTQQDKPEATVRGFFKAFQEADYEIAYQYCTEKSAQSLRDFVANLSMVEASEKESLIAPFQIQLSEVACKAEAGLTQCRVCCSEQGDVLMDLVQQENKWFIQMEFIY